MHVHSYQCINVCGIHSCQWLLLLMYKCVHSIIVANNHFVHEKTRQYMWIGVVIEWFDYGSIGQCPCAVGLWSWESSVQIGHLLLDLQEQREKRKKRGSEEEDKGIIDSCTMVTSR